VTAPRTAGSLGWPPRSSFVPAVRARARWVGAVTERHAVRRLLAALGLAAETLPGRPSPPPDPRLIAPTSGTAVPRLFARSGGALQALPRRPPAALADPSAPRYRAGAPLAAGAWTDVTTGGRQGPRNVSSIA
jgi:hypothetical protein